eukprot:1812351-Amphidinium_carterae.2
MQFSYNRNQKSTNVTAQDNTLLETCNEKRRIRSHCQFILAKVRDVHCACHAVVAARFRTSESPARNATGHRGRCPCKAQKVGGVVPAVIVGVQGHQGSGSGSEWLHRRAPELLALRRPRS